MSEYNVHVLYRERPEYYYCRILVNKRVTGTLALKKPEFTIFREEQEKLGWVFAVEKS